MSKRALGALIVLLVLVLVVVWFINHPRNNTQTSVLPMLSITAFNQTKNLNAETVTASPDDLIVYKLNVENQTNKVISGYRIEINIAGIGDNATLIDATGASYNSATNSLVWTPLDIPIKSSIQKQFSVRINHALASVPNPVIKVSFNNQITIGVSTTPQAAPIASTAPIAVKPALKTTPGSASKVAGAQITQAYKAPVTGPEDSIEFILAFLTMSGVYLVRKSPKFQKI